MLRSFRLSALPSWGKRWTYTQQVFQLVTGGEVAMRNFKCGSLLVPGFGKMSKSGRSLSHTTLASILANNSFWFLVLEDLVKNKNKSKNPPQSFHLPTHTQLFICHLSAPCSMEARPWTSPGCAAPLLLSHPYFHSHPSSAFSWFALHNVLLHRPVPPLASQ